MRKELLFAFAAFFFMSLSAITGVYAIEENSGFEIVSKYQKDVTGDGLPDTIFLKGKPFEEGAIFLKEIVLEIHASNGELYKQEIEGGYEPTVAFKDLNHDQVLDLFVGVATGGSGGLSNYTLYSMKDFKLTRWPEPEPLVIQSEFLNGYKANMTIQNTNESYQFDLRGRAKDYERLGLYRNGKLNEPVELMVLPYGTLKPINIGGGKFGLKGSQRVSGAFNADSIAYVESTWIYENSGWKLTDTKVLELGKNTKRKK